MRPVEKWRFTCPRGHTNWEMHVNVFWCSECARHGAGKNGSYAHLEDRKRGEQVTPDDIRDVMKNHRDLGERR